VSQVRLRIAVTVIALAFAGGHVLWPAVTFDSATVALLGIAALPWLAPLVKSVEVPGVGKVELRELEKATADAENAALFETGAQVRATKQYSFELVADEDPNLALAGLRIEIERLLTELAEAQGLGRRPRGIGPLLRELDQVGALSAAERGALMDMVQLLNAAVHGADVDRNAADWAINVGPRLLGSLEQRVKAAHRPNDGD